MTINYHYFAYIVFQAISLYFLFYSFYWLWTIIIASFYKEPQKPKSQKVDDKWLIVLPAYAPNNTFLEVLTQIREHLPKKSVIEVKVYILFQNTNSRFIDQCYQKKDFWCNHKSFGKMEGNSYINALKFITHQIQSDNNLKQYDPSHILLLDKDNIVKQDFFTQLYQLRQQGYDLIQGRRLPLSQRNGVTSYDQISESLNDMMMRQYRVMMGWMPELSGSAFMASKKLFLEGIDHLDISNPGMDKNLLINWMLHAGKVKSCYASDMIVFEEKTDDLSVLGAQRTRWFAEQYQTLLAYLPKLLKKTITSFRLEILDYLIALSRPPRSVHVLIVPLLLLLEVFIIKNIGFNMISASMLLLGVIAFLTKQKLWSESIQVFKMFPQLIFSNLKSILKIGNKTKGNFIHTERSND